jgi:hypothetical protein
MTVIDRRMKYEPRTGLVQDAGEKTVRAAQVRLRAEPRSQERGPDGACPSRDAHPHRRRLPQRRSASARAGTANRRSRKRDAEGERQRRRRRRPPVRDLSIAALRATGTCAQSRVRKNADRRVPARHATRIPTGGDFRSGGPPAPARRTANRRSRKLGAEGERQPRRRGRPPVRDLSIAALRRAAFARTRTGGCLPVTRRASPPATTSAAAVRQRPRRERRIAAAASGTQKVNANGDGADALRSAIFRSRLCACLTLRRRRRPRAPLHRASAPCAASRPW